MRTLVRWGIVLGLCSSCAPTASNDPEPPLAASSSALLAALAPDDRATLEREIAEHGRTVAAVALVDPRARERMPPVTPGRLEEVARRTADFAASLDGRHAHLRRAFLSLPAALVDVDGIGLRVVAAHPMVVAMTPDHRTQAMLAESVPLIRADVEQSMGHTGAGVGVAILDSGVNTTHQDFAGALLGDGYHALDQGADMGPGGIEDEGGHGSNVAGIVGSRGRVTHAGVAPGAMLFIARVLKADGGWDSDWALALDYVTANRTKFSVPIRVVNLSLGTTAVDKRCPCDDGDVVFARAALAARASGLVLIGASGNKGLTDSVPYPACFSSVLAVGATYDSGYGASPPSGMTYQAKYGDDFAACADTSMPRLLTCFTNRNACVQLVAPGAAITAPYIGATDAIGTYYGTSQAAPHAAGVAAIVLGLYPSLAPDQVWQALLQSHRPRISDPTLPGVTYAFLDAVDADVNGKCLMSCNAGPCEQATCDQNGGCTKRLKAAGADCGVPTCSDGKRQSMVCDAGGKCVPQTRNCAPLACNALGTDCMSSPCSGDGDCGGAHCCSGACQTSLCTMRMSGGNNGGGCSLARSPAPSHALFGLFLAAVVLALRVRRWHQPQRGGGRSGPRHSSSRSGGRSQSQAR